MKKAVIKSGGKQYLVSEGEELAVELLAAKDKKLDFEPLLVIDEKGANIGQPTLSAQKVSAEVIKDDEAQNKVMSIRYKAKKRVHTLRGHRQRLATIKITKIS